METANRAKESPSEREGKYQQIVNDAPTAIIEVNLESSKLTNVNSIVSKFLGYSKAELITINPFDEILVEESKNKFQEIVNEALAGKQNFKAELEVKTKNGKTLWALLNAKVLFKNDKPDSLLIFAQDITERKKAEEALKESESKYQQLVDRLPEMVFEINNEGILVFANSASIEQLGYSKQELLESGFDANRLIAKEDFKRSRENMKKMFTTGKRHSAEYTFVRKDGSHFPVLLISVPITKENKIIGARGIGVDMTEPKRAQQALQESEKRYHQLFDSMSEMLFIADLIYDKEGSVVDFIYVDANSAYLNRVGKSRNQLIGKRQKEHFNVVENYWFEALNEVDKTGESIHFTRKSELSGYYYDVHLWKSSERQVVCISEDITKRISLEKQVQDNERMAAIGQTAGMVGHDLRNPLQTIISELYLAKAELDGVPKGQGRTRMDESIESIETQVDYMDKIVSDLQTFVKPVQANKQAVDLNELVKSTLTQIDIPKNIQTAIQFEDKLTIDADPQLLRRVLINLVTNSVQAMPDGGELMIKVFVNCEGQMSIEVEDSGVGIPEEIKPKIFTPLFTTKSRGQGFGLSVCKRVIEAQGGTINFASEEGKGTKFTVSLPKQNKSKT